jgi:uncharacterized membrane protein
MIPRSLPPHPRFLLFLAVFVTASAAAAVTMPAERAVILGFDVAALVFLVTVWRLWRDDDPDAARARAARDDGGRLLLGVTAALVVGVILLALGRMVKDREALGGEVFATVVATLVLAWFFANLVYAFHYAHVYYEHKDGGDTGGIAFPEGSDPIFADFVYFAFVIGMTCQTADLDIASRRIRRIATIHGVSAFFFNLGVLALTVNVLSGVL